MAFIHSSGLHHTFQWSSLRIISGIEWSSPGSYFDGSFLVGDITFHSVFWTRNVQCVEQHARQISLTYTPYLPVNAGDSVPKRCASVILNEGHCSGLHQSTRCEYHCYWCPGDARSQLISSDGPVSPAICHSQHLQDFIFKFLTSFVCKYIFVCRQRSYCSVIWSMVHHSHNWPNSQIPLCTVSHNASFRTEMCTFLSRMVRCGIWDRCIVGFVN